MDESQAKPNINMKKKAAMGEARAGGSAAGKSLKPDSEIDKVVAKIRDAESVLVALSNDPSVDEIAAAMGLSMALDSAGKHVTAIYSGKTPNVLQFLKPEERFETGTESLQDFVIALNKDKADHLRYKIDGDFVKVYVTPYKTTISGDDIEFSRGDYNVDLVISLNVPAATELDSALKEHGRIMHDATSINITNGAAGKFGDLEWVDPNASSISEMVAKLAFEIEEKMDAATATALLTGLVAATDRFSNPATTPDAMVLAAKLMGAGADQQLVVRNVQGEVVFDGASGGVRETETATPTASEDKSKLEISHDAIEKEPESEALPTEEPAEEVPSVASEPEQAVPEEGASDAVKAAMAEALSPSGAPTDAPAEGTTVGGVEVATPTPGADGYAGGSVADQILNNMEKGASNVGAADYGKMIDDALNEPLPGEGGIQVGQEGPNGPQVNTQDVESEESQVGNPMMAAPAMPTMPTMMQTPAPAEQGMTEEEAMNLIKQGQAEAQADLPGMPANGELPKIIPTGGGGLGEELPTGGAEANPAMGAAPGMGMTEASGVPEMNFQAGEVGAAPAVPSPMPMPGQEIAPPPMTPMPDFGAMPPVQMAQPMPQMSQMSQVAEASMGVPQVGNTIPAPQASEPVPMPDVTVMPDMNAQMATMGSLPQVPEAPVAQAPAQEVPADPTAFKIPGIHT